MNSNNKKKIPKRIIVTACVIFGITFAGKTLAYSNEVMASRNSDPNMDWYKNYAVENNLPHGFNVSFTGHEDEANNTTLFWSAELDEASRRWYKEFAPYSSVVYWTEYSSTPLTKYDMNRSTFIEESKFMENWLNENMYDIISEGMDLDEAKVACYTYILNYYIYDVNVENNNLAKTVVTEKKGACNGFSALFRDMINWMDFDEDWKVTFDKDKAVNKLDMLIIGGNGHAWNSVKDRDGEWKYFDLTFDYTKSNAFRNEDNLYFFNLTEDEFYTDEVFTVGKGVEWVRPKVENREGLHVYIEGYNPDFENGLKLVE